MTVLRSTRSQRGSELRLRGDWLRAAGFSPGDRCEVVPVSPGVLQVTIKAERPADPVFLSALARLEKVVA